MSLPGSRCPACGRAAVPGEDPCLACGATTETARFEAAGTVLARTQRPGQPWVVLVELEGGARVLARWQKQDAAGEAADDEVPAVGARVRLVDKGERLVVAPRR